MEKQNEWALLEKNLDETYVIVTLLKVSGWSFGDNHCSPIVTDIESKQTTTIIPELQERYGKFKRVLTEQDFFKHAFKIIEGFESGFVDYNHVIVRGYRLQESTHKVY